MLARQDEWCNAHIVRIICLGFILRMIGLVRVLQRNQLTTDLTTEAESGGCRNDPSIRPAGFQLVDGYRKQPMKEQHEIKFESQSDSNL